MLGRMTLKMGKRGENKSHQDIMTTDPLFFDIQTCQETGLGGRQQQTVAQYLQDLV